MFRQPEQRTTGTVRSCSIGTNRVGLVGLVVFFTCSIGSQPFSVGLVDQLFQPTRNPVEMVENDGYRPLSQSWHSWALIRLRNVNKQNGGNYKYGRIFATCVTSSH